MNSSSICSNPATRQLVEQVLVQCLIVLFGSHRAEDVPANEFVGHLARCTETLKLQLLIVQLDAQLFHLPIDVPGAHPRVGPRSEGFATVHVDSDQAVGSDAKNFL